MIQRLFKIAATLLLVSAVPGQAFAQSDAQRPSPDGCGDCYSAQAASEDLEVLYQRLQQEHVDLFARRDRSEYDAHIARLLGRIDGPVPRPELHLMLHEAMAFGNIGHAKTEIALNDVFTHVGNGGKIIPLSVVYRGHRMITDNWADRSDALPPGSRITSIGAMPVEQFEAHVRKQISADTLRLLRAQMELGLPAYLYLVFGPVDALNVEYIDPDGTARSHEIGAVQFGDMYAVQGERPVPQADRKAADRVYRDLGDDVFYLQPGHFSASEEERGENGEAYTIEPFRAFVAEAFEALAESGAQDLIIDLRDNGGGDASFSDLIIARLTNAAFRHSSRYEVRAGPNTKAAWAGRTFDENSLSGRIAAGLASVEAGERVTIELPEVQPLSDHAFRGRVWVLVNRHSYSNAAVVAALMQDLGIAKIMGEETADVPTTYGAVESFTLPNSGATIIYPKAYMVRLSGSEEARGVVPDFVIAPNPVGQSRDAMLETTVAQARLSR